MKGNPFLFLRERCFSTIFTCIVAEWYLSWFQLSNIIIETVDTYRQGYFLEKFVANDKPLLLVGPTGTGKTSITNTFLRKLPKKEFAITNISFSAKTSSTQTQDVIFTKLDRFESYFV